MKKTISIITILIMILCLSPISSSAYRYSYKCKDYTIQILKEDSLFGDCKISYYKGNDINVKIPERIDYDESIYGIPRQIGSQSFSCFDFIETITIPETVEYIGVKAFEGCKSLKKITIPPSVKEMREDIFYYCNIDELIIYGYTNSIAEKYANEYKIRFESIGVVPTKPTTTNKPANTVKTTAKTTSKTKTTKPVVKTKKATIKKLTPKKKALKVTWKKVNGAKGYEIKLATNKKFTKNKKTVKVKKGSATSKTIKKLKSKKKYFVKIRAYKKVKIDGYTVTANGPWSKVKSKKIK